MAGILQGLHTDVDHATDKAHRRNDSRTTSIPVVVGAGTALTRKGAEMGHHHCPCHRKPCRMDAAGDTGGFLFTMQSSWIKP